VISEVESAATAKVKVRAYAKEVWDPNDEDQVAYLQKELSILTNHVILANPNIVHLYDWRSQGTYPSSSSQLFSHETSAVMVGTTDGVHDQKRVAVPPCIIMEICDKSVKQLMKERNYPRFRPKVRVPVHALRVWYGVGSN
jgi:hypothetical protein